MHMDKTDTFVKLEAEPSNIVDSHAIAVFIKLSVDYKKVTICASITQKTIAWSVCKNNTLLHNVLNDWFLTTDITKRSLWERPVIKASSKVD